MKRISHRKRIVNYFQKLTTNPSFNICIKGRVKIDNISLSFPFLFLLVVIINVFHIFKFVTVSSLVKSILVRRGCLVKNLLF